MAEGVFAGLRWLSKHLGQPPTEGSTYKYQSASNAMKLVPGFSGASVYLSNTQTVADNTEAEVSFEVASFDTDNYWDSSDPTTIVIPATGTYLLHGQAQIYASGASDLELLVYPKVNGSSIIEYADVRVQGSNPWLAVPITVLKQLTKGDEVTLAVLHHYSTASKDLSGGGTYLWIQRVL